MIDMDKYRVQEEQNGRIVLAQEDAALEPTRDDGHRGTKEEEKENLTLIVKNLMRTMGFVSKRRTGWSMRSRRSWTKTTHCAPHSRPIALSS